MEAVYRITVKKKLGENENGYSREETIFEQTFTEFDTSALAVFLNEEK